MMNLLKNQILSNIMDLFDENQNLENELRMANLVIETMQGGMTDLDQRVYELGARRLVRKTLLLPKEVKFTYDEETSEAVFQGYEDWLNEQAISIPREFTEKEVLEVCNDLYYTVYVRKLNKAKELVEND